MTTNCRKFLGTRLRGNRGFSLIELALVLGIFSLIVTAVFIIMATVMHNQQVNRLQQQIITIVANTRNYASHVDGNGLSLMTSDLCNLGLLPGDIGKVGATASAPCPLVGGLGSYNYTDAINQPFIACAAGGSNIANANCYPFGTGGYINVTLIISPTDCVAVLGKLSSSPSDLGFLSYNANLSGIHSTSDSTNLTMSNIVTNCHSGNITGNLGGLVLYFSL
jgi:prepilin-type N-terminal cleavage/methylation domain-containing protein